MKNMQVSTEHPQTFPHCIFCFRFVRNPVNLDDNLDLLERHSLDSAQFLPNYKHAKTMYIGRVFFSLFLLISNSKKREFLQLKEERT